MGQHLEWCRRRIRSIIHQDKKAVIKPVIEHVEKEKEMVANNTKKLIEVFRVMSRRSEDEKSKQNLHEFFGIWKGPNDHSTIRRYKTVDVCLKRGNVLHKSYQEMMNEGLLS